MFDFPTAFLITVLYTSPALVLIAIRAIQIRRSE